MAAPYSIDLREKIIEQYDDGNYTQVEISNIFGISISTFKRWLKKKRETGALHPETGNKGRPSKIDALGLETIKRAVEFNNSITLAELSSIYFDLYNVKISTSIMYRALVELNLTRKKLSIVPPNRNTEDSKKKTRIC